jgi:hypothetical protein
MLFMKYELLMTVFVTMIHASVCPADIPSNLVDNPNVLPSPSASHLEIYVNGAWSNDLQSNFDPSKPSMVLIHGWRPKNIDSNGQIIVTTIDDYWKNATTALAKRVNHDGETGDINLLGWNWITEASTASKPLPVVVPVQNVFNEGLLLAKTLTALAPKSNIHIIGHSLGAKVAAVTAVYASTLPIDQVTLFDGPELDTSSTSIGNLLDTTPVYLYDNIKILLSRGIFVDNYASAFGVSYQEQGLHCADINMKPPFSLTGILDTAVLAHHYPINWYFGGKSGNLGSPEGTIDPATGDVNQSVGAAWSKVLNRILPEETIEASRTDYALGNPSSPINGLQFELAGKNKPYKLIAVASVRATRSISKTELSLAGNDLIWESTGDVTISDANGANEAILTESNSSEILSTTITVPEGNAWMTFDFKLISPQPTDKLTVLIGETLLWSFSGIAYPEDATDFITTDPIDLSSLAGKTVTVNFCWNSNKAGETVLIQNIRLYSRKIKSFYHMKTKTHGAGVVYPQDRIFEDGTVVTLRAIPHDGYSIWAWRNTDDEKTTEVTNTATMNSNKKIEIFFIASDFPNCLFTGLNLSILIAAGFLLIGKWQFKKDNGIFLA